MTTALLASAGAQPAKQTWVLLVVLGVVVALVALLLVAQRTDPDRQQRADRRHELLGEGWHPRKVVRHVPADEPAPTPDRDREQPAASAAEEPVDCESAEPPRSAASPRTEEGSDR